MLHTLTIETLIAGLGIPAILIGPDDRVLFANQPAEEMFGTLVGRRLGVAIRHPAFLSGAEEAARTGLPADRRVVLSQSADGEQHLAVHFSPLPDGRGGGLVLATATDLTLAERTEAMRRDFVANVSHELRTPLTALQGFIETLRGPARDDPVARARFLSIMDREAGRMARLINDLLSLSRVEAAERSRPTDRVDLMPILGSVVTTLRPQAEAAGMALPLSGPGSPVFVQGDADQLMQVFQNLVENAIRYAAAGGEARIETTVLPHDPQSRGPAVAVAVIDRGEGIDPVHLPRLTERFYRADAHRSREKGGTGLGLAIVKHIVNRHRGRLKIDSEMGKGSRFTVFLPLLPAETVA
jgi:two-component system phosphate regulon sensor histidine kinase PhoR